MIKITQALISTLLICLAIKSSLCATKIRFLADRTTNSGNGLENRRIDLQNIESSVYTNALGFASQNGRFNLAFDISHPLIWVLPEKLNKSLIEKNSNFSPNLVNKSNFPVIEAEDFVIATPFGSVNTFKYRDNIQFSDFNIMNSSVYVASDTNSSVIKALLDRKIDGVHGLGLNGDGKCLFLERFYQSGIISSKKFSLYLNQENGNEDLDSELVLEGIDERYVKKGETFVKFYSYQSSAWSIGIEEILINQESAVSFSTGAILSSTIDSLVFPDTILKQIIQGLNDGGLACEIDENNRYFCLCEDENLDSLPNLAIKATQEITLEIENKYYLKYDPKLSYEDLVKKYINSEGLDLPGQEEENSDNKNTKTGNVCWLKLESGNNYASTYYYNKYSDMILGIPFLQAYYTFYDGDASTISIVKAEHNKMIRSSETVNPFFMLVLGTALFYVYYYLKKRADNKKEESVKFIDEAKSDEVEEKNENKDRVIQMSRIYNQKNLANLTL